MEEKNKTDNGRRIIAAIEFFPTVLFLFLSCGEFSWFFEQNILNYGRFFWVLSFSLLGHSVRFWLASYDVKEYLEGKNGEMIKNRIFLGNDYFRIFREFVKAIVYLVIVSGIFFSILSLFDETRGYIFYWLGGAISLYAGHFIYQIVEVLFNPEKLLSIIFGRK